MSPLPSIMPAVDDIKLYGFGNNEIVVNFAHNHHINISIQTFFFFLIVNYAHGLNLKFTH